MSDGSEDQNWRKVSGAANYLTGTAAFAVAIIAADVIVLLILGRLSASSLTLSLFLEGGIGLLLGVGIALSSTPTIARLGQTLLETSPWSRDSERHAERVGLRFMLTSAFLIMTGFAVSSL